MTSKTLGAVFTSVLFAGTVAFAQDASTQQNPYTTGQQAPSTTTQQAPYTTGQQAPYTTGQAATGQTRQMSGTVTAYQPNKEITVTTTDGKKHKFNLSTGTNTTVSPDVSTGAAVLVTETMSPSGATVITIAPAGPTPATGTSGTSGASGQY